MSKGLSRSQRIGQLVKAHPDKPAITFIPIAGEHLRISRRELDETSN